MAEKTPKPDGFEARVRRFGARSMWLAFASGLLVAVTVSSGVVWERVLGGNVHAALAVDVLVLCAAVVAASLTSRPLNVIFTDARGTTGGARLRSAVILAHQLLGVACGIGMVHVALKHSGIQALSWMSECPAQLVNDAVAAMGTLIAIWVCASHRLRWGLLIQMLGMLLLYGATRQHWHADRAPFTFQTSIQDLVVSQVVAASTGLLAFRRFSFG